MRPWLPGAALLLSAAAAGSCTSGGHGHPPAPSPATIPLNPTEPVFQLSGPPQPIIGPATFRRPACRPGQIAAHAVTKTSAYGVLGVVRMRGTAFHRVRFGPTARRLRCSLPVRHGPTQLLDAAGRPLAVPLSQGNQEPPPSTGRPDIPVTNGIASWGFSWLGSYCGSHPSALRQPLTHHRSIVVPISGPTPRCTNGSGSELLDGVAGDVGAAVQPAPPSFARLRLHLDVRPGTTRTRVADLDATLTTTGEDVVLSPCPFANGRVSGDAPSGGFGAPITAFQLDCVPDATVVSRAHPLHFVVAGPHLTDGGRHGARPGSIVTIEIGIAGMPSTTVEVQVP